MAKVAVKRWRSGNQRADWDVVLEESPLEIRVSACFRAQRYIRTLAVTMRTSGSDEDLAVGLLFSEGIIGSYGEITTIYHTGDGSLVIELAPWVDIDVTAFDRSLPILTSSCGVCGKSRLPLLEDVVEVSALRIKTGVLTTLAPSLEAVQTDFTQTGGSHAAAAFNADGQLLRFREDVGRHNALDKLIGSLLTEDRLPLTNSVLFMTSRASYDILQKAIRAGIPVVATAGGPSSAAVDLADRGNLTLIGFLRNDRFNVYTRGWRIA